MASLYDDLAAHIAISNVDSIQLNRRSKLLLTGSAQYKRQVPLRRLQIARSVDIATALEQDAFRALPCTT